MFFLISLVNGFHYNPEHDLLNKGQKQRRISSPSDFFEPQNSQKEDAIEEKTSNDVETTDLFDSIFGFFPIFGSIFFPHHQMQKTQSNNSYYVCHQSSFHMMENGTVQRVDKDCSKSPSKSFFFSPKKISSPLFHLGRKPNSQNLPNKFSQFDLNKGKNEEIPQTLDVEAPVNTNEQKQNEKDVFFQRPHIDVIDNFFNDWF